MYQIDSSGSVPVQPTPSAAGTPGYFTGGNPATATPATVLDADFFNAVMMELVNIVTAAGLTPTKGTNNQVLAAIRALAVQKGSAALAGTQQLIGWAPATAGSDIRTVSFTAPADGIVIARSIVNSLPGQTQVITNSAAVNGVSGSSEAIAGPSVVSQIATVTAGQSVTVTATASVGAATAVALSHWLEYQFLAS